MLRTILIIMAAVTATSVAATQPEPIKSIPLPPSQQRGVDMMLIDPEAMPAEPELAGDTLGIEEERFSGSAVDLLRPMHHLYRDLRRQLVRYQIDWSSLPQVRIPADTPIGRNASDPRLPALRERLGLPREGGSDQALRTKLAAFQRAHGLESDGIPGTDTLRSLNRGAAHYERLIQLNMERARRLPAAGTPSKYILVDAGSARLWMYENGQPVDSMKVVVGSAATETPMMAALIRYASVNPYWNIPPELVRSLIAPRVLGEGKAYLTARGYEVLDGWEEDAKVIDPDTIDWPAVANGSAELRVRQLPGPSNSMGEIKFMMPNEYGIYLHDTPNRALFGQDNRWVSNGCVRLEDARRLARWIFGDMPAPQDTSRETRVDLETPVPVYITYLTVAPDRESVAFRSDPYQRDETLLARFDGAGDGMMDMPVAAPERAVEEPEMAPARTRDTAAPTPTRKAAGAASARQTRQRAAQTAAASREQAARRTATPARETIKRTDASPPARRAPARTAAAPASRQVATRQSPARAAAAATSRQRVARTGSVSASRPATRRTPAASAPRPAAAATTATAAKPAPKSRPAAARRTARASAE